MLSASEGSLRDFESARLRLARGSVEGGGSLAMALQSTTELAADTIRVERCGIWLFIEERRAIRCFDLFERSCRRHSEGAVLRATDFPSYFAALERLRVVQADEASLAPATRELEGAYLAPLGIGAMLDAPLFRNGRVVGVVCHEHVGAPRTWTPKEIDFVSESLCGTAVEGKLYCRRHAGVVRAVGAEETPSGGLPDVDNRAPSLVSWIARDLDANVRRLLSSAARTGESVIADETVHVARDFNRKARWEQSWRLVDHTGVILKVTIQVLEENDSLVRVHVGSGVIADGVPPWIVRRAETSDMASDTAQRQRFYQWLDESIFMAVDRFRTERQR